MLAEHPSGLQPHTRVDIPSWGSLLFIYANLLVPTLLAILVGTNMLIWTASRINYVFIFGTVSRKLLCNVKIYLRFGVKIWTLELVLIIESTLRYILGGFVTHEKSLMKLHRRYLASYSRLFAGLFGSPLRAQENPLSNRGRGQ